MSFRQLRELLQEMSEMCRTSRCDWYACINGLVQDSSDSSALAMH